MFGVYDGLGFVEGFIDGSEFRAPVGGHFVSCHFGLLRVLIPVLVQSLFSELF